MRLGKILPPWTRGRENEDTAKLLALLDASCDAALAAELALDAGAPLDCAEVVSAQEAIHAVVEELDRLGLPDTWEGLR